MSIIAFDVDDTLIIPAVATGLATDTPNYEMISLYLWFQKQGHRMIIWSGGGEDYARMWAEKLGLKPDVVAFKCVEKAEELKPDIAFDDCNVELARVNIKVKRISNWKRRENMAKPIKL